MCLCHPSPLQTPVSFTTHNFYFISKFCSFGARSLAIIFIILSLAPPRSLKSWSLSWELMSSGINVICTFTFFHILLYNVCVFINNINNINNKAWDGSLCTYIFWLPIQAYICVYEYVFATLILYAHVIYMWIHKYVFKHVYICMCWYHIYVNI